MRSTSILTALFLLFLFSSCKETEVFEETEHLGYEVIDDNDAPPFSGITTVQINNYVNKIYIDLLGREPLNDELEAHTAFLKNNNVSLSARENVISELINTQDYYRRFFETYSSNLLNGISLPQMEEQLTVLFAVLEQALQNEEYLFAQLAEQEIQKLQNLINAISEYQQGSISVNEYIRRHIYNLFYDEINMGSENFVLACFENLHKRFPTEQELQNGVTMTDGFPAQILFQDGSSKLDFTHIITSTPGFYEGLVVDIYQQLLARLPDSAEMGEATLILTDTKDYQSIQIKVLKSDEYAGF